MGTNRIQAHERELGRPIHYLTYPRGHYNKRVKAAVQRAGYVAAFTMRKGEELYAGQSQDVLSIERFGQSRLTDLVDAAWGASL